MYRRSAVCFGSLTAMYLNQTTPQTVKIVGLRHKVWKCTPQWNCHYHRTNNFGVHMDGLPQESTLFSLYSYYRQDTHACNALENRLKLETLLTSICAIFIHITNMILLRKLINIWQKTTMESRMSTNYKHNARNALQYDSPPCDRNFSTNDCS